MILYKHQLILTAFLFCSGIVFCQSHPTPRSYVAYKTETPVNVDGEAKEESWQKVPWSEDFIDIEGKKIPTYQTNMKMLWDEDYLYFYAKMEEPHIWATLKQRDTVMYYNNDFEIFIDPTGDTHNYIEFEMNALNTVWDLLIVKPYREPAPVIDSWEILGLKSAVHIEGSLNDPSDKDQYWSVEVAIPWEVLKEVNHHDSIPVNEFWRVNFSRVNWDYQLEGSTYSRKKDAEGKFLPEYNWVWSPQWVINMHEPEKWGYVYFSPNRAGEEEMFNVPQDEKIRWFLYDLYRAQRAFRSKNGSWATSVKKLYSKPILIDGKKISPDLEVHKSGWNITVESPFTGKQFLIKEDGKFVEL